MFTGRKSMAKKSPALSRREGLTKMTSEDIKNRKWTETERRLVKRHAAKQAAGDDSDINYDDIPRLTDEQLAQMVLLLGPDQHASRFVGHEYLAKAGALILDCTLYAHAVLPLVRQRKAQQPADRPDGRGSGGPTRPQHLDVFHIGHIQSDSS